MNLPMLNPNATEGLAWKALRQVIDPELGCNLVDLGLIYDLRLEGRRVGVKLTFTTPGCPMHDSLVGGVEAALCRVPGIEEVQVEVVWDPPWNPDMLTEAGKAMLGCR